jgi:hypothetical protein
MWPGLEVLESDCVAAIHSLLVVVLQSDQFHPAIVGFALSGIVGVHWL